LVPGSSCDLPREIDSSTVFATTVLTAGQLPRERPLAFLFFRPDMNYPFPKHRIDELVASPKVIRENETLETQLKGDTGASFDVLLDLVDGPFVDFRYLGKAGNHQKPTTYAASLILAAQRVRGVDYCALGRRNFRAKFRIPPGWHQNICDPNKPTFDPQSNRHVELPHFSPTDFGDFISRCADLWRIDLKTEAHFL
jgi:hypothetical protein